MVTKKLQVQNDQEALLLLGEQDVQLRRIEHEFGVEIYLRHDPQAEGLQVSVRGSTSKVDKAPRPTRPRSTASRSLSSSPRRRRATRSISRPTARRSAPARRAKRSTSSRF